MGQPITVVEKKTSRPGVVRFEINRSITGMGHERYTAPADAISTRPADELARRLFAHGCVEGVHMYSNVITVDIAKGGTTDGMLDTIRDLFLYYREDSAPAAP